MSDTEMRAGGWVRGGQMKVEFLCLLTLEKMFSKRL